MFTEHLIVLGSVFAVLRGAEGCDECAAPCPPWGVQELRDIDTQSITLHFDIREEHDALGVQRSGGLKPSTERGQEEVVQAYFT